MNVSFRNLILIDLRSQILPRYIFAPLNRQVSDIYSIKTAIFLCEQFIVVEKRRQFCGGLASEMKLYVKSMNTLFECMDCLIHILIDSTV